MENTGRKRRMTAMEMAEQQRTVRTALLGDLRRSGAGEGMLLDGERVLAARYGTTLRVVRGVLGSLCGEALLESVPRGGMRLRRPVQALAGKRFAQIGFMQLHLSEAFATRPALISAGLEKVLSDQGGTLEFFNTWLLPDFAGEIIPRLQMGRFDAILYTGHDDSAILRMLSEIGIPLVAIECPNAYCDSVEFDNAETGRMLAEHLLGLGHRDVAILRYSDLSWSAARTEATCTEFARQGAPSPEILDFNYSNGKDFDWLLAVVPEILSNFSALIAPNDHMAWKFLQAAQATGSAIPEYFSITGADDLPELRSLNLTTIQLSHQELGEAAYERLRDAVLNPGEREAARNFLLKGRLIVRSSTKPFTGERS